MRRERGGDALMRRERGGDALMRPERAGMSGNRRRTGTRGAR